MSRAAPDRWLFDVWSRFYDLPVIQRATYRPIQDAVVDAVGARLRRQRRRTLLDVGCGTGQLVSRLATEMPSVHAVGCDFSAGMLAHAAARAPHARWVRGDACRLPFGDGAFDAVVSTEAFHWFPDQAAALREFRRVLAPDGRLMLALVNPRFTVTSTAARLASRLAGEPFTWPTASALRAQLTAAGFRLLSQRRVFRLPGLLLFPPMLTVAAPAHAVSGRRPRRSAAPPPEATARATR